MIIYILNIISWTSLFSQLLLVILYSLGILFYKYNKSVSQNLNDNTSHPNASESVEYFSEQVINNISTKEADFKNYDDYSEFSNEKHDEVNALESITQRENNEPESLEENSKIMEDKTSSEFIENSDEDYVPQNAIPTATIEDEEFEQISFNLQNEQENSITMVDDEDIKRVFQNKNRANG